MLLNVQPKTVVKIERAREIFSSIAYEGKPDELSIRSVYYLGRINQTHQSVPHWAKASHFFEELISRWPEHPYAQIATAKYAEAQLYEPNPTTFIFTSTFPVSKMCKLVMGISSSFVHSTQPSGKNGLTAFPVSQSVK